MRKFIRCMALLLVFLTCAASAQASVGSDAVSIAQSASAAIGVIGGADGPTAVFVAGDDEGDPQATPTPAPTAAPVTSGDLSIEVTLGYDGMLVYMQWMPCFITVENHGADFDGTLGVNVFYQRYDYDRMEVPLTVASGAVKQVMLPIVPRINQDMYAFELVSDGRIVAETRVTPTRVVASESIRVGLLSTAPDSLGYFGQRSNSAGTLRGEAWHAMPLDADTFPQSLELMQAFQVLVVDGIDVRTLSTEQQKALRDWLLDGGVCIVSGGAKAATSWPFFSEWTGLQPSAPAEQPDITPVLLDYTGASGEPAGESIWMSDMPAAGALVRSGNKGVLRLDSAGSGLIFTAAFDMGAKPITVWRPVVSLWPRLFQTAIVDEYNAMLDTYSEENDLYSVSNMLQTLTVPSRKVGVAIAALLAAGIALGGFGAYWLLRRLDRREWMWVVSPLLAVALLGVLALLGGRMGLSDPMALSATRILLDGEETQAQTYLGVASAKNGDMSVQTDQRSMPIRLSDDFYTEETGDKLFRPLYLRNRYQWGENPTLVFVDNEPWDARYMRLSGVDIDLEGGIDVRLWMEADGMHGAAVNNTGYLLEDCLLITGYGYCRVGEVLPGQTVELALIEPDGPVDYSSMAFRYQSGVLYTPLSIGNSTSSYFPLMYDYGDSLYTFIQSATIQDGENPDAQGLMYQALIRLYRDEMGFYDSEPKFLFFALNDQIGRVQAAVDGKPVTRTAHRAILGTTGSFEPIGPTGEVFYPQHIIPCEQVVYEGGDTKPRAATLEEMQQAIYGETSGYLELGSGVALRFVLPEHEKYDVQTLRIASGSYDSMPTVSLYNNQTQCWDEQITLTISLDGETIAPYIDEEGAIYLRYLPQENANRYDGMNVPTLTLKGKVKGDA